MRREGKKHNFRTNHTIKYIGNGIYSNSKKYHFESKIKRLGVCSYCGKRKDCDMVLWSPNHWKVSWQVRKSEKYKTKFF
jgi:hypothetical protein